MYLHALPSHRLGGSPRALDRWRNTSSVRRYFVKTDAVLIILSTIAMALLFSHTSVRIIAALNRPVLFVIMSIQTYVSVTSVKNVSAKSVVSNKRCPVQVSSIDRLTSARMETTGMLENSLEDFC